MPSQSSTSSHTDPPTAKPPRHQPAPPKPGRYRRPARPLSTDTPRRLPKTPIPERAGEPAGESFPSDLAAARLLRARFSEIARLLLRHIASADRLPILIKSTSVALSR